MKPIENGGRLTEHTAMQFPRPHVVEEPTNDSLSLLRLLDPGVLVNPYVLYHSLLQNDPVHWDPYMHAC
jgi:hypothetical protein